MAKKGLGARTPKTTIPGVYAIAFRGFNREELQKRARHLVGVGYLTLAEVGYPADELLAARAEQTRARRDRDGDDAGDA